LCYPEEVCRTLVGKGENMSFKMALHQRSKKVREEYIKDFAKELRDSVAVITEKAEQAISDIQFLHNEWMEEVEKGKKE